MAASPSPQSRRSPRTSPCSPSWGSSPSPRSPRSSRAGARLERADNRIPSLNGAFLDHPRLAERIGVEHLQRLPLRTGGKEQVGARGPAHPWTGGDEPAARVQIGEELAVARAEFADRLRSPGV